MSDPIREWMKDPYIYDYSSKQLIYRPFPINLSSNETTDESPTKINMPKNTNLKQPNTMSWEEPIQHGYMARGYCTNCGRENWPQSGEYEVGHQIAEYPCPKCGCMTWRQDDRDHSPKSSQSNLIDQVIGWLSRQRKDKTQFLESAKDEREIVIQSGLAYGEGFNEATDLVIDYLQGLKDK